MELEFKYETLRQFYFLCGLLGHSEQFCPKHFEVNPSPLMRQYGPELRAQNRRNMNSIGERWLRSSPLMRNTFRRGDGCAEMETDSSARKADRGDLGESTGQQFDFQNLSDSGTNQKGNANISGDYGGHDEVTRISNIREKSKGLIVVDSKRRRVTEGLVEEIEKGDGLEVGPGVMDLVDPKNVITAGLGFQAYQDQ